MKYGGEINGRYYSNTHLDENTSKTKHNRKELKRNSFSHSSDRSSEKFIFSGYYGSQNQPTMAEQYQMQHQEYPSSTNRELVFFGLLYLNFKRIGFFRK